MTTVVVAPRELIDLIYRANRLRGADPGHAALWARQLVRRGIENSAILTCAENDLASGRPAQPRPDDHDLTHRDQAIWSEAQRSGVAVAAGLHLAFEQHAHGFLVAEHLLDQAESTTE